MHYADVVILNDAPPLLGRAVITDGLPAFVNDQRAGHEYRRDVQLRAADLEPFITPPPRAARNSRRMTYLIERLAQLRRHVRHLRSLTPRVTFAAELERDQSLSNDVLFSLLMVAQLVADIAGELSTRHGRTFGDYTEAVRNLAGLPGLDQPTVGELARLPGLRNVGMHEYVGIDYGMVATALTRLQPVERLIEVAAALE